ncbi:P-loop containing nucleoside triphosphate hydrolase protein [Polyplosphaeria fusca]|uniref:P-loop containing nucleoside triphosphate hydrolase protein n=1 Tax=Polyplosphaeria fusca TaxID=682080 RepID=A0A9P4QRT9_9PLEO|nr:P-loop containing nucleoside triphosphate hydrolase protein [Polyplosphaeria fusca]
MKVIKNGKRQARVEGVRRPRLIVALAGSPGSGKTTAAGHVAARVNQLMGTPHSALVMSIDGFHLPRSTLDALPNREEAYARRGAHWTFDAAAAVAFILRSRARTLLSAPTFDHAKKDPVADGLKIPAETSILILEGNYLLCDLAPWSEIAAFVDEKWFIMVDPELARRRVAARHVRACIEPDLDKALKRVDGNDALNGQWINEHRVECDVVVESVEDIE